MMSQDTRMAERSLKRLLVEFHPDKWDDPMAKRVAQAINRELEEVHKTRVEENKGAVVDMKRVVDQYTKKKAISAIPYQRLLQHVSAFQEIKPVRSDVPGVEFAVFTSSGYRTGEKRLLTQFEKIVHETADKLNKWSKDLSKLIKEKKKDTDESYDDSDVDEDDDEVTRAMKKADKADEKLHSRREGAKKLAAATNTTELQLKKSVDLVKSAFRRSGKEPVEFDCDGNKLGFKDGLFELVNGTLIFRDYTKDDLVSMSCGYDAGDLESEKTTDDYRTFKGLLQQWLPNEEIRTFMLKRMAKIAFDGHYAWFEKMFLIFIAPKDFAKTALMKMFEITLGDYAVTEDNKLISKPGPSESALASILKRIHKTRFVRIDEGPKDGQVDWLTVKKLTSSSGQTYRTMWTQDRALVNCVGSFALACNEAEAPMAPESDDILERLMMLDKGCLTHMGDVDNPALQLAKKCALYEDVKNLRRFRRSFLCILKEHFSTDALTLPAVLDQKRKAWAVNSAEPAEADLVRDAKALPLIDPQGGAPASPLVPWLRELLVPDATEFVRAIDIVPMVEANAAFMDYIAKSECESSRRVVAIALRKACPMALGMIHNFVQGPKPHCFVYYNKKTVIGAHYGGVKVVGWHLPGFKLRSMLGAWRVEGESEGEGLDEGEDDVAEDPSTASPVAAGMVVDSDAESRDESEDERGAGPSAPAVAGDDSESEDSE